MHQCRAAAIHQGKRWTVDRSADHGVKVSERIAGRLQGS